MIQLSPSHRRDPRTELAPGAASVEFEWTGPDARLLRGDMITASATGLAFTLAENAALEPGTTLPAVTVRSHDTIIHGDLSVRYARRAQDTGIEVGCLFYPASVEDSGCWVQFVKQRPSTGSSPPPQLPLRCSTCHSTVWICDTDRPRHLCPVCRQEYGFDRPMRDRQLEELHQQARGMAFELGIDLPSAVSMLLGMLNLAEVRDILDEAPSGEPAAPGQGKKRRYDRAFQPAIEAGTLTEAHAIQRGSREVFARKLVARHRIGLDAAYDVADNRTTLLSLLRKRTASEPIIASYRRSAAPARSGAVAALALIALLVGIAVVRQFDKAVNQPAPEPETRRERTAVTPRAPDASEAPDLSELPVDAYARVQADDRGGILRVEAADPGNVLLAFCESNRPERRLEPVDVVATEPPLDGARLGLLRDLDEEEDYRVVVIRRDPQTRRWFLGSPGVPDVGVSMFPAPARLVHQAARPQ